jgi:hypothetical protein
MRPLSMTAQAGLTVLLWGPPGPGKSSRILELGRRLGPPAEVVIAFIREPSGLLGLSPTDRGQAETSLPDWPDGLPPGRKGDRLPGRDLQVASGRAGRPPRGISNITWAVHPVKTHRRLDHGLQTGNGWQRIGNGMATEGMDMVDITDFRARIA